MSYWNFAPGSLGGYEDLEQLAKKYRPEIEIIFDERVEKGEGLIDDVFELQNVGLKTATDAFSTFIIGHQDRDAEAAAYRAVHFAFLLREQISTSSTPLRFYPYVRELARERIPIGDKAATDVEDYLQPRQALGALIMRYYPHIDTSGMFESVATTMAGLTLMQFDVDERNQYIDRLVSSELPHFNISTTY